MTPSTEGASGRARLLALITNDDGIDSEGLRQLALAARAARLDVLVAAPIEEASGTGGSLTAVQTDGRVVVEERRLEGLDGIGCYAVAAAPAFIVRIACRGAFGRLPDVVLSGINRGANTGNAILHSGTVGAALTGHLEGRPSMAVSLAGSAAVHWGTAAHVTAGILPRLLAGDEPLVLNLNVPDVPAAELRGLRLARLASYGAVQTTVTEVGQGFVRVGWGNGSARLEPDSDAMLLSSGHATLTVLESVTERSGVELPELTVPRAS
ncbi:MAG: 5'/3'-nucleotidase SurE [Candidatus Dormibacteria bacterium]